MRITMVRCTLELLLHISFIYGSFRRSIYRGIDGTGGGGTDSLRESAQYS